jgi:hypothetical protein
MKTFKIEGNDISDGYHTFDELYEHRCLLFVNLCLTVPKKCAWKIDASFGGWLCLYLETPHGQISYHIPETMRRYIEGRIMRDDNYKWDGHNSVDVVDRLKMLTRRSLNTDSELSGVLRGEER